MDKDLTLEVKLNFNFRDLKDSCYGGALVTLNVVELHHKQYELVEYLIKEFSFFAPTIEEVNDYLWFRAEHIFEVLDIDPHQFHLTFEVE